MMTLTALQRSSLATAIKAHPAWVRSRDSGERVTLASLYRQGLLDRQARRGEEGAADAAYEYRPTSQVMDAWKAEPTAQRKP